MENKLIYEQPPLTIWRIIKCIFFGSEIDPKGFININDKKEEIKNEKFKDKVEDVPIPTQNKVIYRENIKGETQGLRTNNQIEEKEALTFYDSKSNKKFKTNIYEIIKRNNCKFAVTISPSGIQTMRVIK